MVGQIALEIEEVELGEGDSDHKEDNKGHFHVTDSPLGKERPEDKPCLTFLSPKQVEFSILLLKWPESN